MPGQQAGNPVDQHNLVFHHEKHQHWHQDDKDQPGENIGDAGNRVRHHILAEQSQFAAQAADKFLDLDFSQQVGIAFRQQQQQRLPLADQPRQFVNQQRRLPPGLRQQQQ